VPASEANETFRRYGTIVVVGGGCYGSYYVQQLRRARERQAIDFAQMIVVDRDPMCAVAVAAVRGDRRMGRLVRRLSRR
jgi:predicted metal-binding protein